VHGRTLAKSFLYSAHCFVYVDKDSGRSYPGIIDLSKFKNETLYNNCALYYKGRFGVWLYKGQLGDLELEYPQRSFNDTNMIRIGVTNKEYDRYHFFPVFMRGKEIMQGVMVVGFE
jgi:hypothetical protein